MKIEKTFYKGIEALSLESGDYQAVLLPGQGAKLCSLISLTGQKEFVYQGKTMQYRVSEYGMDYLNGECAGVDEMFPNIDECFYTDKPWKGTLLPDHGEVWALPWKTELAHDKIIFSTHGVRLPYHLVKEVCWEKDNILRMDYTLRNLSAFPMDYIWAAHMMLTGRQGAAFSFPPRLSKAYTTMSDSEAIGRYGDTFYYPAARNKDGVIYDMSIHRGKEANDYQKFYFADRMPGEVGWGMITYPDGHRIKIEFPTDRVPYLGAIQAEGGSPGLRCMFLEPCTGAFDRPDLAKKHSMNSILEAHGEHTWYLKIRLEKTDEGITGKIQGAD